MIHTNYKLPVILSYQLITIVYTTIQRKFDTKLVNYLPQERFGKKLEKALYFNKLGKSSICFIYTKAQRTAKVLMTFKNYNISTPSLESNIKYTVTYGSAHTINRQLFIDKTKINPNNSLTSHSLYTIQPAIVTFKE